MPIDTCNTCSDVLCPHQGHDDEYKCGAFAPKPNDTTPEDARQAAIREMNIKKGRDLCYSKRALIFKDGVLTDGPYHFTGKDYLLIGEAVHFLPHLHTKIFRPALEITLHRTSGTYRIIILSGGQQW